MRVRAIHPPPVAAEVTRRFPTPRRLVRHVIAAAAGFTLALRNHAVPRRISPIFLALTGALLGFALPQFQSLLIYDREAILAGELWRLFTGHWVHFSATHLGCNLAVLGVAGLILETGAAARTARLLLVTPWFISAGLLLCEPQLNCYGGLSGLATAAVVALALDAFARRRQAPRAGWTAVFLLLLFGLKTVFEWHTHRSLFTLDADAGFMVVPLSHLLGGIAALVLQLLPDLRSAGGPPASTSHRFKTTTDGILCRHRFPWTRDRATQTS